MDPLSAAVAEIEANGGVDPKPASKKEEDMKNKESVTEDEKKDEQAASPTKTKSKNREVRTKLPVTQPDKVASNLWTFLKQCIGKELTKISMPVQWNEPISLLQRISEYMNYAYLLKKAAAAKTSEARLEAVATFAVSALASNFERMGKPFNPLLGETYELERPDFRILCEQVGHHPPVSAWMATDNEGGKEHTFKFHGSLYPKVKFWGKSVEFRPQGTCTVEFPQVNGEAYTWNNVNCVVHNIIVGSLWMEQQGVMEITNQVTKARCVLSFKPGGWFGGGSDLHTVEGFLVDHLKKKIRFIYGRWTEFLCSVDVDSLEDFMKAKMDKVEANASNLPKHAPFELGEIPNSKVLWHVDPRPEDSNLYYNFSNFTMGLNEYWPDDEHKDLCKTDCRHRPDIRALEDGDLDLAVNEKDRLEQKQREYRKPFKNSKKESDWWTPRWFMPAKNEFTKEDDWRYVGGYWDKSPAKKDVPDIF